MYEGCSESFGTSAITFNIYKFYLKLKMYIHSTNQMPVYIISTNDSEFVHGGVVRKLQAQYVLFSSNFCCLNDEFVCLYFSQASV